MRLSLRRASSITAVSETTKWDLVRYYAVDPKNIIVTGEGIDIPDSWEPSSEAPVERPYIIYPAMLSEHKNHTVLFRALANLADIGTDLRLILTGKSTGHEESLRQEVSSLGLSNLVEFRGFGSLP